MRDLGPTLAIIWRLAVPYFRSEDRWPGRILLGAVIAIELATVGISVLLNQWNNRFYNALQNRDWNSFLVELRFFCVLAAAHIVLVVYQLYLNQWLQIRWRRWMTRGYLDRWLTAANHYRMQLNDTFPVGFSAAQNGTNLAGFVGEARWGQLVSSL